MTAFSAASQLRKPGWWAGIRVLVPLGALIVEGWPAAIGAVLVQEGALWLGRRWVDAAERSFASKLFIVAFALRAAIALPTHYIAKLGNGNGALFQDDYTNDLVAEWLGRIARGDGLSIFPGHQHLLDGIYPYLLMAVYSVFGHTPLLPKLLNSALAGLSAVLVFELTRRVFSRPAALLAAAGAVLLPTLVVWSVVAVKETPVLLFTLVGLGGVQRLTSAPARSERAATTLVVLLAVIAVLLDLRSTTALILVGLLLVMAAARCYHLQGHWQVVLVGTALMVLVGGGVLYARGHASNRPISGALEDVMLQIRHRRAQEAANARSQIRPETEVVNPTGHELPLAEAASDAAPFSVVDDVINPLGYALLSPAPWQARSLTELAASAEMLVWYVLIGGSLIAWWVPSHQRLFVMCLVAYGVANWLVLAISEGNLGNLLRHRVALAPALLVLGAGGLDWLRVRLAQGWAGGQPPLNVGQAVLANENIPQNR